MLVLFFVETLEQFLEVVLVVQLFLVQLLLEHESAFLIAAEVDMLFFNDLALTYSGESKYSEDLPNKLAAPPHSVSTALKVPQWESVLL